MRRAAMKNGTPTSTPGAATGRGVPSPPAAGEVRVAHMANARLAAENARLRADLTVAGGRLAAHDQSVLEFAQVIAHHLRTPLGLIKGYVGTLRNGDLSLDPASREEFLAIIDDETDAVSRVVNHLIDLAHWMPGWWRWPPGRWIWPACCTRRWPPVRPAAAPA